MSEKSKKPNNQGLEGSKDTANIVNLNEFPIEIFPEKVQDLVTQLNESLMFPIDFTASSMLYVISIAIGNTYCIEIKRGYTQPASMYMALIGTPGTVKTHPLSHMLKPIIEKEREYSEEYKSEKKAYDSKVFEENKKPKKEREKIPKPIRDQILVSDITQEALVEALYFNYRGLGLYVDEFAGWLANINKYGKGDNTPFYLSIWSGSFYKSNRKTSEGYDLHNPFLSIGGTIQPEALVREFQGKVNDGFSERILFCYPSGLKKEYLTNNEIKKESLEIWGETINRMLNLKLHQDDDTKLFIPMPLKMNIEAKNIFFNWQKRLADRLNNELDIRKKGIYAKAELQCARLTLIMEVLHSTTGGYSSLKVINKESVQNGIKLAEYFIKQNIKVLKLIGNSNPLDALTEDKKEIYNDLSESFNIGECVALFKEKNSSESTAKRFLKESGLFLHVSKGKYKKRFK